MHYSRSLCFFFFFFNDTATTEIYTLSLHDALPISRRSRSRSSGASSGLSWVWLARTQLAIWPNGGPKTIPMRSEEHTSELQSLAYLVCRLLLEKKKKKTKCYEIINTIDQAEMSFDE